MGQCGISLHGDDLNRLLSTVQGLPPIKFQHGCFQVYVKLPMGFGATLVAIPHSSPGLVTFSVPFDQIRGDRSGGFAKMLAGGLWGPIRGFIEKQVRSTLGPMGFPADTLTVEQDRADSGGKVGKLVLRIDSVNAWLLRQPPMNGFKGSLDSLWVTEDAVNVVLDVFGAGLN